MKTHIDALRQYLNNLILPSGRIISSDGFTIRKLRLLQIPAIKGLLYFKIFPALNQGLQVTFELTNYITNINLNKLD